MKDRIPESTLTDKSARKMKRPISFNAITQEEEMVEDIYISPTSSPSRSPISLQSDASPKPMLEVEGIEDDRGFPVNELYEVPPRNRSRCHLRAEDREYFYKESMTNSDSFWRHQAQSRLRWITPFTAVSRTDLRSGNISWFNNGKINVCDNCVDRWAEIHPEKIALVCESDTPSSARHISYGKLRDDVCRFANLLMRYGVRRHDTVGIYLPTVAECVYAMLACTRIGAIHVCVFAGFSANALADRLVDAHCKVLVTANGQRRGGKMIHLKQIADKAMDLAGCVRTCFVFTLGGDETEPVNWKEGRDVNADERMFEERPYCPIETCDAEDILFLLHTSGSTGLPKGIAHTTAGYLLYASLTHEWTFDIHKGDVYCCAADVGWITGHSYVVYGPLCNGTTTVLFNGTPTYPNTTRYWQLIQDNKVTQFYTAPTALRLLMREDPSIVNAFDLSSLRVLGSVGEPINAECWRWYFEVVGRSRCSIVDTYWQTETGGHVLTPLPGAQRTKPGSCALPFPGIDACLLDPTTGTEIPANVSDVSGLLCMKRGWPGMLRTIWGNHHRFVNTYLKPFPGYFLTGDAAYRDADGYYWIIGRVDDMLNISGHRVGTAEVEFAMQQSPMIAESCVVGVRDDIKGEAMAVFVVLKPGHMPTLGTWSAFKKSLAAYPRSHVGPIATPSYLIPVPQLPKTRSGKIIRRVFRKLHNFTQLFFEKKMETAEGKDSLKAAMTEAKLSFFSSSLVSMIFTEEDRKAAFDSCGCLVSIQNHEAVSQALDAIVSEALITLADRYH